MTAPGNGGGFCRQCPLTIRSLCTDWRNDMICTIIDIRGDYAYLMYQDTRLVSEVALGLLPFGVDVGDKLKFEDFEFTLV